MRGEQFHNLLASIPSLTERQLDELVTATEGRRQRAKALQAIETAHSGRGCAHCGSDKAVKNGHSRGLQRYRCRACRAQSGCRKPAR